MLVKVRLPATMPQLPQIPKMSIPVSMSDVDMTLSSFPSSSNILLSLLAVTVLATFVRTLWLGLQEHFALVHEKKQQQRSAAVVPVQAQEKSAMPQPEQLQTAEVPSSWLWGLIRWERHHPAPSVPSSEFTNEKQSWPQYEPRRSPAAPGKRTGPAFARPLPTLYESDIPVSMAKMIMSRHTFRRPTSRPPPARAANTVQIQRKIPPPPTTSSSLTRPPSPPSPVSRSRSPSPPLPVTRSHSRSPSPPRIPPATSEEALRSSGLIV